jgi:hypothetical protein
LASFVTENFVLHELAVSTIVGVNGTGYMAGAVGAKRSQIKENDAGFAYSITHPRGFDQG